MSEEEKQVLNTLKNRYGLTIEEQEILLNLIDKLQKENKNAEERNYSLGFDFIQIGVKLGLENFGIQTILLGIEKLQKENDFLKAPFEYANGNTLHKRYVEMNFISKDKIKDKIKELEEEKTKLNKEAGIDENIFTLPINLSKVSYIVYAIEVLEDLLKGE